MMKYFVLGGGRTGSHWVSQVLINIIKAQEPGRSNEYIWNPANDPGIIETLANLKDSWVVHTNILQDLDTIDKDLLADSSLLISCRDDVWASCISVAVARRTDEWYKYNADRTIEPFRVSPREFYSYLDKFVVWYEELMKLTGLFKEYKVVWFEDMAQHIDQLETYVASILDIDTTDLFLDEDSNWAVNRNPRNYSDLIINWSELKEVYQIWLESNRTNLRTLVI